MKKLAVVTTLLVLTVVLSGCCALCPGRGKCGGKSATCGSKPPAEEATK